MTVQVDLTESDVDEPVTLINAFTVPPGESELFLERWKDNARVMAAQPGFLRARMYHALTEQAELNFVNVAEWRSGRDFDAARANPEWRASIKRMIDDPGLHVTPRPVVHRVGIDVRPGDAL
ncbi:antibiotic biosynthesis monooxygenase [Amycolatopsis sp. 195334CR]|nr:antibiotic biosynthesis monooxygenase [Amycolatopsis sp. 195334CR]